jgi:O-antigen ligase
MVLGTGLKGLLGTERTITMANVYPRPTSLLEHDESVFFSCYILLTVALWVFGQRGSLRRVATALLPLVVVADLGNNRRAAWVMLPAMLLALAVVAFQRMPDRRRLIVWVVAVLLVIGSAYVLAFRYSNALFAQPAHAIWSNFRPDPRDASSNLYRQLENLDLGLDIRSSPVLGQGFGVPIPHPVPLLDATEVDPLINFIPHNNILYVWVRMGLPGAVAFWFVVGAGAVAACQLARHPDRRLVMFGMLVLAALIAWVYQGWLDKGIVSFRITILVGVLLGALQAVRRDDAAFLPRQREGERVRTAVARLLRHPGAPSPAPAPAPSRAPVPEPAPVLPVRGLL